MSELSVSPTAIDGLLVVDLPVHGDSRGWFKENWQREKMVALGLPDFAPVQQNMSFNDAVGVTRGVHAEPWDKLVSVGVGRVFGAWVDLRPGAGFGSVFTTELHPGRAVFVPRGVGNAFQTLEAGTLYSYLVNDHWSAAAKDQYTFVQLADPALGIQWPIALEDAVLSDADRAHPHLADVVPMPPRATLVLGAGGQLGRALRERWDGVPEVRFLGREDLDLADRSAIASLDLSGVGVVVNAAAYTAVDAAETPEGRVQAWAANAGGVAALAQRCRDTGTTLVHVSSDYVFDGHGEAPHTEDEPLSPLGVYGQSKAAGDLAAQTAPRHYVLRTSWVVGDGGNFVKTMASLADRGISPQVVEDQRGRLTTTATLAAAIDHLLGTNAAFGVYNVTGSGEPSSWAEIAREVFRRRGRSASDVTPVSTAVYSEGKSLAPRPLNSVLDLSKIEASGFAPEEHLTALDQILAEADPSKD